MDKWVVQLYFIKREEWNEKLRELELGQIVLHPVMHSTDSGSLRNWEPSGDTKKKTG